MFDVDLATFRSRLCGFGRGFFMMKRTFAAGAGLLGLCLSLSAQQTYSTDVYRSLNILSIRFPTLSDEGFFSFASAFKQMETTSPDFLPALTMANMAARSETATAPASRAEDSSKEVVGMPRNRFFDYADGEVGLFYGRSIGNHDLEVARGYIFGEVGNDTTQISAGASYERLSGRVPRWGR